MPFGSCQNDCRFLPPTSLLSVFFHLFSSLRAMFAFIFHARSDRQCFWQEKTSTKRCASWTAATALGRCRWWTVLDVRPRSSPRRNSSFSVCLNRWNLEHYHSFISRFVLTPTIQYRIYSKHPLFIICSDREKNRWKWLFGFWHYKLCVYKWWLSWTTEGAQGKWTYYYCVS